MIVLARFRACCIFVSARFFFLNFASATFFIDRLSTAASFSLASSKSFSSYTGGGRMYLRSSSKNHSGRSSSLSRAYLLYASSMMRSLCFLLIIFFPIAISSAFSPSLRSSTSVFESSDPPSDPLSLSDPRSYSASISTKPALSFPLLALLDNVPNGSSPSSPLPPSSSLLSVSSSYVSSWTPPFFPPFFPPPFLFFDLAAAAASFAFAFAAAFASRASSFFFLIADAARKSSKSSSSSDASDGPTVGFRFGFASFFAFFSERGAGLIPVRPNAPGTPVFPRFASGSSSSSSSDADSDPDSIDSSSPSSPPSPKYSSSSSNPSSSSSLSCSDVIAMSPYSAQTRPKLSTNPVK
mmetsp:Transcript_5684/g.20663  ORF Transcript_5684/g.20663 Transcript_5684/m.20663 type:complete len:353 (-) Transcript_5684:1032-2090(-)